ncbi:MAG: Porin Omp2b [Beijerinckiaceae bacterium]|nr:MAG: Porin Omp2b [Beijerinckiaceae bacterium]
MSTPCPLGVPGRAVAGTAGQKIEICPLGMDMKLLKGLLLGSAASLAGTGLVPGARAADLPARQAAPIEYVRICDAYGAGFFYIPGTETCLRVGGLVLGEFRGFDPSYSIAGQNFYGNGITPVHGAFAGVGIPAGVGYIPSVSQYTNARSRDATDFDALGRAELDARTQSPWGTLRAFARIDAYYGSGGNSATGSLGSLGNTFNTTAGSSSQRETTIVNKAFIQFAGLTAGYAQSMFDFYADAYNYNNLRGSNATTSLIAYTATFDNGFSATLSAEDQASRRAAIGSTIAGTATAAGGTVPVTINGISATSFQAQPAGARVPDVVGNLRYDQPWGAVQLTATAHQVRASLFEASALTTPAATVAGSTPAFAFPALTSNSYGFAIQGGMQLNADYLSPGDKLWLQAAYEKGAFGYIAGNNLGFNYGAVNQNRYAGSGFTPSDYSAGWNAQPNSDCVFTGSGACEEQSGFDITGAYKHYWIPTLSSGIYGSYMQVNYPGDALAGFGGGVGISNIKEARVGSNLVWTPLKGFDIGAEFMYVHVNQTRPAGLAPDFVLNAAGLPSFQPNTNQYEGRLRVQRAF